MYCKSVAVIVSLAFCTVIGCGDNPVSSSGSNAAPNRQPSVADQNYSNPGQNPGLSGAAPHPDPTPGTDNPAAD